MPRLRAIAGEVRGIFRLAATGLSTLVEDLAPREKALLLTSLGFTALVVGVASRFIPDTGLPTPEPPPAYARILAEREKPKPEEKEEGPYFRVPLPKVLDYSQPARERPGPFRINQTIPAKTEGSSSGSIKYFNFDPKKDLVRIEDDRVWWESDNDDHTGDTEDDHLMHKCMEDPFRRLVEIIAREGKGQLKVQDAYRAKGVHSANSLHKQGRGIDLTAFDIPLSKLAAMCVEAGFDWVYYESRGGHHVHASERP